MVVFGNNDKGRTSIHVQHKDIFFSLNILNLGLIESTNMEADGTKDQLYTEI